MYVVAIGCPDPDPITHASVKRDGDTLKVTCNHTSEKWHLVCKGTQWIGDIRNCSAGKRGQRLVRERKREREREREREK